jgi:nucleotide-binding universal stress UspA family protein
VVPCGQMFESRQPPTVRRIVLGLNGGATDDLVVRVGCEIAKPQKATLIAVHVIEVDWTHDLAEVVPGSAERASNILDLAEGAAERAHVPIETQLLQARHVAAALVDEAVSQRADLMLVGLPYRKRFGGDFVMGRTILYTLENAPMTVYVVREPIPAAAASAGASSAAAAPARR